MNKMNSTYKIKPAYILVLVVAIFISISSLTLGIWLTNNSQDNRSYASGSRRTGVSCNQSCQANKDCAINLRCYQGVCRLAINPTSPNCRVTSTTPKVLPTSATVILSPTPQPTATQTATVMPTLNPNNNKQNQTSAPKKSLKLIQYINAVIKNPKNRLPMIIFTLGIIFVFIALFSQSKRSIKPAKKTLQEKNPNNNSRTSFQTNTSSMTQRLKHKQVQPPRSS